MNTVSPGRTRRGSPSSTIWSPSPARMYRISSESGWLWRSWPFPGSRITCIMLTAVPSVLSAATSGLITPQSNVMVGSEAGSTNLDGTAKLLSRGGREALEPLHVLGHGHLGGQPLHARRAEEAHDALGAVEHVLGVL